MYKAGVPIEKISKILGHKDIKMTIEYLGLNIDDMSESLAQYAQYMKNPFEPKMVQNDEGQEIGGQSGNCRISHPDGQIFRVNNLEMCILGNAC